MLANRDYTLILDKSGSMSIRDQAGGKSRWQSAEESTIALANKCEEFDPDGITVYTFSSKFRRRNVESRHITLHINTQEPQAGNRSCHG